MLPIDVFLARLPFLDKDKWIDTAENTLQIKVFRRWLIVSSILIDNGQHIGSLWVGSK